MHILFYYYIRIIITIIFLFCPIKLFFILTHMVYLYFPDFLPHPTVGKVMSEWLCGV